MTTYWVRVSRAMWEAREDWLDVQGWELTGRSRYPTGGRTASAVEAEVEDQAAPPELGGHLVDVGFQTGPDGVAIAYRLQID